MGNVIVRDITLIDGTGAEPLSNASVCVKDGKFALIGSSENCLNEPPDAAIYEGKGKYMMPGLINLHDHLYHRAAHRGKGSESGTYKDIKRRFMELPEPVLILAGARDCALELVCGTTTVRDCGTKNGISFALRRGIQEGIIPGPRILAAGHGIKMTGGHMYPNPYVADGPEPLRQAVRLQIAQGADFIKVMATGSFVVAPERGYQSVDFTVEELTAVVEEAHRLNRKVSAHCDGAEGIKNAVAAGIDTIEHGLYLDDEVIDHMLKQKTALVPTLSGRTYITEFEESRGDAAFGKKVREIELEPNIRSFQMAHKAGIKVGTGTDTCGEMVQELELFVRFGMNPLQAIRAATGIASEICGLQSEIGTLEEGKIADFIILSQDPLKDITALRKLDAVFQAGSRVSMEQFYRYENQFID